MSTVAERIRPLKAVALLRMGLDVPVGKRALLLSDGQPLGVLPSGHYDLDSLGRQFGRRISARLRAGRPSLLVLEDREIHLDTRLAEDPTADGGRMERRLRLGVRIADPEAFYAGLRESTDWVGTRWLDEVVQAGVAAASDAVDGVITGADFEDTLLVQIEPSLARHGIVVNSLAVYRRRVAAEAVASPSVPRAEPRAGSVAPGGDSESLPPGQDDQDELRQVRADAAIAAERARGEKLQLDAELEARSRVYDCEMEERVRWFEQRQREAASRADLEFHHAERMESLSMAGPHTSDPAPSFDYDSSAGAARDLATEMLPQSWTRS